MVHVLVGDFYYCHGLVTDTTHGHWLVFKKRLMKLIKMPKYLLHIYLINRSYNCNINISVAVLCTGLPLLYVCLSFSQGMTVSLILGTTMTSESIPQFIDLQCQVIGRYGVAGADICFIFTYEVRNTSILSLDYFIF